MGCTDNVIQVIKMLNRFWFSGYCSYLLASRHDRHTSHIYEKLISLSHCSLAERQNNETRHISRKSTAAKVDHIRMTAN